MVGVFQLFGVSFLFWVIVGLLRFIFETLRRMRDTPRALSRLNLALATFGGIGVSTSLFFLVFIGFGLAEALQAESALPALILATLIVWLACIGIGAYLASRIYIYRPYLVSGASGIGTAALAVLLLIYAGVSIMDALASLAWEVGWISVTLIAALLGGHIAAALNALERERTAKQIADAAVARIKVDEVAIIVAAHNEELTIGSTVESVLKFTDPKHVYVGSDGSSDRTVDVVRSLGAHADDIQPNRGKAGAIVHVLEKNKILDKYRAVFLMDADLQVNKDFLSYALPQFDDPNVAAVVGHAVSLWPKHYIPQWHLFFTAYRIRLWRVLQFCLRYGQTWKYTNVSPIVPGGGSIYRTEALRKINIVVPGLIIEDFNMTFDIHHKKLGLIAFDPRAFVINQEPFSLQDYAKQVYRWYLGYFQTVRHHGIWPSWFCFSTTFFSIELFFSSILFAILPFLVIELILGPKELLSLGVTMLGVNVTIAGVILTVLVFDYLTTIVVAAIERKPMLLLYGPGFFFLRYIEIWIFLYAMMVGLFTKPKTEGKWKSPKRVAYTKG